MARSYVIWKRNWGRIARAFADDAAMNANCGPAACSAGIAPGQRLAAVGPAIARATEAPKCGAQRSGEILGVGRVELRRGQRDGAEALQLVDERRVDSLAHAPSGNNAMPRTSPSSAMRRATARASCSGSSANWKRNEGGNAPSGSAELSASVGTGKPDGCALTTASTSSLSSGPTTTLAPSAIARW